MLLLITVIAQSGNRWILVSRATAGGVIPQKELILPANGDWNNIFPICFKRELSVVILVSAPMLQERQCRNTFRNKIFTIYKKKH